ncbi:MAG: DUF4397 domain-containing protein [Microscillaceae bacterium]|nr:DUF4397 domain-containing protein [Microscillaceae bacterium]MDW8460205.1 hypothetical protein [Cytophagales bacterium]
MLKKLLTLHSHTSPTVRFVGVCLLIVMANISCRKFDSLEVKGDARLLIFNAAPDIPPINVFVGNSEKPINLEPVGYTPRVNAGSYRPIPHGNQRITVKDVQGGIIGIVQDALTNYIAHTPYSLFVIGSRSFRDRWRELTLLPAYIDGILLSRYPATQGRPAGDYNRDGVFDDKDRDGYAKEVFFMRMNTTIHVIPDNRSSRPTNQFTAIRLVNGAPDAVDLVPAGTDPAVNPYGSATHPLIGRAFDERISFDFNASLQEFVEIPAGQTMVFRATEIPDLQLLTIPGQELKGGKMYTVILSGYYEPPVNGAPRLKYTLVEHN